MRTHPAHRASLIERRLKEAEATIDALMTGQIDAVVNPRDNSPVLLAMAQTALRESEERYRRIVETANEGIWTIDTTSTITFVNPRLAEMLGYATHEMLGQPLLNFIPSAFHQKAIDRIRRAELGTTEDTEVPMIHKKGLERWVLVKTTPILDVAGDCVGILAMITDWTPHRDAERALHKSETEYRQIVESTTDGIIKVNRDGIIAFVNVRFAQMLGYQPNELVGTSLLELVAPSEVLSLTQSLRQFTGGISTPIDTIYRHRNGTEISVNIAGSALRDDQGRLIGTLGVVRDVTEAKKLQAQLIVSDRMASVGMLAAGVAHEINNPLTAVISNLEYMDEGLDQIETGGMFVTVGPLGESWLREHFRAPLNDAQEAAERVRFIVRDLKMLSRSPSDEPSSTVDVTAILESSIRMAWNEIRHRARLVKQLRAVPFVIANEARLGQVLLNLIVNAAQSLPVGHVDQNEICINTHQNGGVVFVEISDSGAGIAPENLDRIFDAFFTTKAVGVGTGLGLAICQRIVTDMGGTLTVTSTVGVGSTFCVAIPMATTSRSEPTKLARVKPLSQGGKILVVDDEETVLRSMQRVLGSAYEIETCSSASAALALIEAGGQFDLILCDLMMPNMTGMDLHGELLARSPAQARGMIFMTGGTFTGNARQFVADPDIVHIEKPFKADALRRIVHQFLHDSGVSDSNYPTPDFSMNAVRDSADEHTPGVQVW